MPAPRKRADQRTGHSKGNADSRNGVTTAPSGVSFVIPEESKEWHAVARGWYRSLAMSGQSRFYEASDWAMAWVGADALSMWYSTRGGYGAGALLSQFIDIASKLMCTEGDRRKMRIELIKARAGADAEEIESEDATAALESGFVEGTVV